MTILQSLNDFYERLDKRGDVPKPGYMLVPVSFAIPIAADGSVRPKIDLREAKGNKHVASDQMLPKMRDHNNSGKDPFLFWDKTAFSLGVAKSELSRISIKEQFDLFKKANLAATEGATSLELMAFRRFLERWNPEQIELLDIDPVDYDTNIVFRSVDTGELIHETDEARAIIAVQKEKGGTPELCLITGEMLPPARLHPKFPPLEANGSKGPIVSFNERSFESYGKDQGANAPVSERAAFRYGTALNWLLDRDNSRSIRIGEATIVFWADEREVNEKDAQRAEELLFWGMEPQDRDIDQEEENQIWAQINNAAQGRAAPDTSGLDPSTRMHILALSPNAGRIAVRFWLVDTFGHLAKNLLQHLDDLALEPPAFKGKPKTWALLRETATQHKYENIPPRLGGELMQAILTGNRYPRTLLSAVIGRIRADKQINGPRTALIKAVINREIRRSNRNEEMEAIPMALNPDSNDTAYNLGRLFAVYEYAESSAARRNATIKDKYIGAASATPRRVFPILMRGYEHNASKLAKGDGKQRGSGIKAAKAISGIIGHFDGDETFPQTLNLENQARFFVGYYHQNAAMYARKEDTDQEEQQQ